MTLNATLQCIYLCNHVVQLFRGIQFFFFFLFSILLRAFLDRITQQASGQFSDCVNGFISHGNNRAEKWPLLFWN